MRPAAASASCSPLIPDLPTIDESGVPGHDFTSWNGFFAPRGMPRSYIMLVHATIQKTLADRKVKNLYTAQGMAPLESASPEEFSKFFREDFDRVAKLIKIAGIKPE